jgi:DNA modification methylase
MNQIADVLIAIREKTNLSQYELAQLIGTSLASIVKWESNATTPSPAQTRKIRHIYESMVSSVSVVSLKKNTDEVFASTHVRQRVLPLFDQKQDITLSDQPHPPILQRISSGHFMGANGENTLNQILGNHIKPAPTVETPPPSGMSAGKNTYTYDAHTYHTKVPPQGIAELLKHYLPHGGLVFDPFAGSGMTGVAARVFGYDCILNELSPAACFIADRFTSHIEPELFRSGVEQVLEETQSVRRELYTTHRRNNRKAVEFEYIVWSYRVICYLCGHEFILWDHCRKYGKSVREHKILSQFPCPRCHGALKKSKLQRSSIVPVMVAYKDGNTIEMHPLDDHDLSIIDSLSKSPNPVEGFYPQTPLYEGVNLRQPIKHGLNRVDKFYTHRNLVAMSHLWQTIHRIEDPHLAAFMAFVFTSLYQRVTRFSEFRFWGGSGNTANFNVPFIFKEANVFTTFERKARTIQDQLETTASHYTGQVSVVRNSATSLGYLPDGSIDLIFTDPPFGANINYSEMNILWEAWLGEFTDTRDEVIINKFYHKDLNKYKTLMAHSLAECYRVLRDGHWMLLVFMNSSEKVWEALREAIVDAGFKIYQVDIFDKHHSTFKQLVSENTASADLVLHCRKAPSVQIQASSEATNSSIHRRIENFLENTDTEDHVIRYIHVEREEEIDFRTLYSEWIAKEIAENRPITDFAVFRSTAQRWINRRSKKGNNATI